MQRSDDQPKWPISYQTTNAVKWWLNICIFGNCWSVEVAHALKVSKYYWILVSFLGSIRQHRLIICMAASSDWF